MPRDMFHQRFSVFLDCAGMSYDAIRESLNSLVFQSYRHFEVILLGASPPPDSASCFADGIGCIGYQTLTAQAVLSGSEKDSCKSEYVLLLMAGDRLEPHALQCLDDYLSRKSMAGLDLLTFDYVREEDRRRMYLPGWDPEFLQHLDYIRTALCLSSSFISRLSGEGPFAGVRDFLLRASGSSVTSAHIGKVLLHVAQPAGAPRPLSFEPLSHPALSIIIPDRNGFDLMPRCVAFLRDLHIPFDLVVIDNGSDDPRILTYYRELEQSFGARILPFNQPFNYARMINVGVKAARHELVLLLNNDVFISEAAVIPLALGFASRPEIGVVGSVLRYPNGSVQHAGMALRRDAGGNCEVDHVLRSAGDDEGDYLGALTAPRNWQSVTGAFQLVRRSLFLEVGGYDEVNLPVEHNDVDFCLRIRKCGRRVICLPLSGVFHDESHTRRHTPSAEASLLRRRARDVMAARWPDAFRSDPFVHPDLRPKVKGAVKTRSLGTRASLAATSLWRRLTDGKGGAGI